MCTCDLLNMPDAPYLCGHATYLCYAKFELNILASSLFKLTCAINVLRKTKLFEEFRYTGKKFFHSIKL